MSTLPPPLPPLHETMKAFVVLVTSRSSLPRSVRTARMHLLRDVEGWSALDLAVAEGNMIAFDRFCSLGADPFMLDSQNLTWLAVASQYTQAGHVSS